MTGTCVTCELMETFGETELEDVAFESLGGVTVLELVCSGDVSYLLVSAVNLYSEDLVLCLSAFDVLA